MKTHLRTSLSIFGLLLPLQAAALRIDGLPPGQTLSARDAEVKVVDSKLQLRLSDRQHLTVAPWPAFLPQKFDRQDLTAGRQALPAGPSDRISLARPSDSHDWLVLANGSRRAAPLVGEWRLQLSDGSWYAINGAQKLALSAGKGRATALTAGEDRWCIYLLESNLAKAQASLATEQEAQAAWAALRMTRAQKQCPK
jgi:hypothetical protein